MGSRARPATGTATRVPRPLAASRRDDEKKEDNGRERAAGHSHRRGSLHGLGQLLVLGAGDVRLERRRLCGRARPIRLGRRAGADRGRGLPDRRHLALARRCRRHERRAVLMPIALTEEHEALRRTAERWLETHCPAGVPRAVTEAARADQAALPDVWEKMAAQGWLGLHVPEELGGQGFTPAEVAVVLEELGHALFPGPVLPTLVVSAALASYGTQGARTAWLPGLSDGSLTAGVALGGERLRAETTADGTVVLRGSLRPVLGLPTADLVLVPAMSDPVGGAAATGTGWWVLDLREAAVGV